MLAYDRSQTVVAKRMVPDMSRTRPLLESPSTARTLAVVTLLLAIVGCAAPPAQQSRAASATATPSVRPSPSDTPPSVATTPIATTEPTATPSLAFEPPAGFLPPNSLAMVVVDALHIRAMPSLSSEVIITAGAGETVYLRAWSGPITAEDAEWYSVAFAPGYSDWPKFPPIGTSSFGGWAAAAVSEQRYLEPLPPRCPDDEPDLDLLSGLSEWERLACFADRELTVVGTYEDHSGSGYPGDFQPAWLTEPSDQHILWAHWLGGSGPLALHIPPGSGLVFPPAGSLLQTTGHFNDPSSVSCTMTREDEPAIPVDSASAELYCRERFVVDAFEVIGTDPNY